MSPGQEALVQAFLTQSVQHLRDDFLPKIRQSIDLLTEEELWQRGSDAENSVGNLLLHLSGNVRQWILSGLGGAADRRDRPAEFAARGGVTRDGAMAQLEETVAEACEVILSRTSAELLRPRVIQRHFERTGLQAILHVVEHFSYHTGQIVYATKMLRKRDLKFYDL